MKLPFVKLWTAGALMALAPWAQADMAARAIPRPLPSHPGNIFLSGEGISVAAPSSGAESWRATDYEGNTVACGLVENGRAELGKMPVGYYELAWDGGVASNHITLGVIEPLRAPTPLTSPIGIDVAMAWFFPNGNMAEPASLCALAGMNRVRMRRVSLTAPDGQLTTMRV